MVKTEEALAIIGGHVDEELLLRNEYLAIENEILRKKIEGRIKLSQCERIRLATIGQKIGIKEPISKVMQYAKVHAQHHHFKGV